MEDRVAEAPVTRQTSRRSLRRRPIPLSFAPWGLFALVSLIGVLAYTLLYLPGEIEGTVQRDVTGALGQAGHGWAQVRTSGQHVVLTGAPPSAAAAEEALVLARGVRSTTGLGPFTSPVFVDDQFAAPRAALPPSPASWRFRRTDTEITLSGQVADETTRDALVQAAGELVGSDGSVVDELQLGATDTAGRTGPSRFGMGLLGRCLGGVVSVDRAVVSLDCEVLDEAADIGVRERAIGGVDGIEVGEIRTLVRAAADACDEGLTELLSQTIRFASGSEVVLSASHPLIDRISLIAQDCPGELRIEGHTDAQGDVERNVALSHARAESVKRMLVVRGVSGDSLRTVGHGPHQPIGDNATAKGRAANRRIEIEVVRPGDLE